MEEICAYGGHLDSFFWRKMRYPLGLTLDMSWPMATHVFPTYFTFLTWQNCECNLLQRWIVWMLSVRLATSKGWKDFFRTAHHWNLRTAATFKAIAISSGVCASMRAYNIHSLAGGELNLRFWEGCRVTLRPASKEHPWHWQSWPGKSGMCNDFEDFGFLR